MWTVAVLVRAEPPIGKKENVSAKSLFSARAESVWTNRPWLGGGGGFAAVAVMVVVVVVVVAVAFVAAVVVVVAAVI
eukprot:COSAG04_NODE_2502_length_4005_cov_2.639017_5_plen_77_part_00